MDKARDAFKDFDGITKDFIITGVVAILGRQRLFDFLYNS